MYEDKTLICKDCGNEFTFTAGEQEFYAEKGFVNEPQRCKTCRDSRKNAARGEREIFTARCAS
ncbi:MAG: zinc-ribbon domain-containing protein, partial [Oscillospiraceae bacterium]